MGEGAEQTPIGLIEDVPFVEFVNRDPTNEELESIVILPDEDLYGPMLRALDWEKEKKAIAVDARSIADRIGVK